MHQVAVGKIVELNLILLNIFLLRSAEEMRQILELRKCTKIDAEKKSYKEMRRTLDAL